MQHGSIQRLEGLIAGSFDVIFEMGLRRVVFELRSIIAIKGLLPEGVSIYDPKILTATNFGGAGAEKYRDLRFHLIWDHS